MRAVSGRAPLSCQRRCQHLTVTLHRARRLLHMAPAALAGPGSPSRRRSSTAPSHMPAQARTCQKLPSRSCEQLVGAGTQITHDPAASKLQHARCKGHILVHVPAALQPSASVLAGTVMSACMLCSQCCWHRCAGVWQEAHLERIAARLPPNTGQPAMRWGQHQQQQAGAQVEPWRATSAARTANLGSTMGRASGGGGEENSRAAGMQPAWRRQDTATPLPAAGAASALGEGSRAAASSSAAASRAQAVPRPPAAAAAAAAAERRLLGQQAVSQPSKEELERAMDEIISSECCTGQTPSPATCGAACMLCAPCSNAPLRAPGPDPLHDRHVSAAPGPVPTPLQPCTTCILRPAACPALLRRVPDSHAGMGPGRCSYDHAFAELSKAFPRAQLATIQPLIQDTYFRRAQHHMLAEQRRLAGGAAAGSASRAALAMSRDGGESEGVVSAGVMGQQGGSRGAASSQQGTGCAASSREVVVLFSDDEEGEEEEEGQWAAAASSLVEQHGRGGMNAVPAGACSFQSLPTNSVLCDHLPQLT
jgi:hypothetical protein